MEATGNLYRFALAILCCLRLGVAADSPADTENVHAGIEHLAAHDFEGALQYFLNLIDSSEDPAMQARARCGAAQALTGMNQHAEALEFYQAALAADGSESLRIASVHFTCAQLAVLLQRYEDALGHIESCKSHNPDPKLLRTAEWLEVTASTALGDFRRAADVFAKLDTDSADAERASLHALRLGLAAYKAGNTAIARKSLARHIELASSSGEPNGEAIAAKAWMEAEAAADERAAAGVLERFAAQNSHSRHAAAAWLMATNYRVVASDTERVLQHIERLSQWPSLTEQQLLQLRWFQAMFLPDPAEALAAAAAVASELEEAAQREALSNRITATANNVGEAKPLVDALQALARLGDRAALARVLQSVADRGDEQLVATVVDSVFSSPANQTSQRQVLIPEVCRWLATTGRHSVLVARLDADVIDLERSTNDESRFWLAEALVHTGAPQRAIAVLQTVDRIELPVVLQFSLAVRITELAVEHQDADIAKKQLDRLQQIAKSPAERCQQQILGAQFAMRQADFATARTSLESVVRQSPQPDLQARAQWMIGETWFMQRNYVAAIEAYRTAETLAPGSEWRPLALLQAGKCFESIHRQPEAVACYTALMADGIPSHYQQAAMARLSALGTKTIKR